MTAPSQTKTLQPLALGLAVIACLVAAAIRLSPHAWGVTLIWNLGAVGALALFAGARVRSWFAYLLPLLVMLVTDVLIAQLSGWAFFYPGKLFDYTSFLVYVLLGRRLTRTENPLLIGAGALAGSLQFFLVSNLGVWVSDALLSPAHPNNYAPTLAGLLDCYLKGVPFYGPTLAGDLLFTAVLFGAYALLTRWIFHDERVPAQAHG